MVFGFASYNPGQDFRCKRRVEAMDAKIIRLAGREKCTVYIGSDSSMVSIQRNSEEYN
jgi:hypothetical protein